ncbi:zinc ribbon domain-containing protein [Chloroflexi bacterium TSY]|nr:zinc ribbon domain-containing protein [Chloroflexi bacterium TSY]
MPLYEFICHNCENEFEKIVAFSDTGTPGCPFCQSSNVQRKLGMPAIHFKGSGWYINDSKEADKKQQEKANKNDESSSKSEDASNDGTSSKETDSGASDNKSESKEKKSAPSGTESGSRSKVKEKVAT